mgnify:CR=1 FL=1
MATNYPVLTPEETMAIATAVMTPQQKAVFDEKGENDLSYSMPNYARFRVNVFKQRGSAALALRLVGTDIPTPEQLGIPESVVDLYTRKRGLILVTGPTGSGKSTIANLLARLWDVKSGNVTIRGVDIRNVPLSELMNQILSLIHI